MPLLHPLSGEVACTEREFGKFAQNTWNRGPRAPALLRTPATAHQPQLTLS